jgi:hypothetical protein
MLGGTYFPFLTYFDLTWIVKRSSIKTTQLIPKNFGRAAPVFFLLLAVCGQAIADEVRFHSESVSNRGSMTNGFWQAQKLSTQNLPVIGYADQYIRGQAAMGVFGLFIEKRKTASFVGDSNALVLAANNNLPLDISQDGKFDINGQFKSFEFDAFGLQLNVVSNPKFRWSISPKLISLTKFTSGSGSGTFTNQGGIQTLNGDTFQDGMSSYGFKRNTYDTTLNQGFTLDTAIELNFGPSQWSVQATNLYSEIPVSGIFFSNEKYQVRKIGDRFIFLQNAPVIGTYGQNNKTLTLPRIIRSTYIFQLDQSRWLGKLGGVTIEGRTIPWFGVGYQKGSINFEMNAYDLEVVQWVINTKNLLIPGFDVQFSISVAPKDQVHAAFTSISYSF